MPIRVEIYVGGGIVSGVVGRAGRLRDALESGADIEVERARWRPLDGAPAAAPRGIRLAADDVWIAAGDDDAQGPVHAVWHHVSLAVGPYLVEGDLPTMPGFDPGRALTRPSGSFVLLRDVRISLADRPTGGAAEHPHAHVNRYAVDEVNAEIMLGFFFPGAHYPPTGAVVPAG